MRNMPAIKKPKPFKMKLKPVEPKREMLKQQFNIDHLIGSSLEDLSKQVPDSAILDSEYYDEDRSYYFTWKIEEPEESFQKRYTKYIEDSFVYEKWLEEFSKEIEEYEKKKTLEKEKKAHKARLEKEKQIQKLKAEVKKLEKSLEP